MSLKNAHYVAMQAFFLTDEEIEEDWEQFCKDLGIQFDEIQTDYELPEEFFQTPW